MSTLEALQSVCELLQPIAPTYLRGTLREDATPKDPQHFILDDISLTTGYGLCLDPRYDYVVIQVSAWAKGAEAAYTLSQAARDLLEPLLWRVQGGSQFAPEGVYRGHQITYRKLY